jgi:hypothetical protein
MRVSILFIVSLFVQNCLLSQDYFQQKVDYNISVVLDDELQELKAEFELVYQNNSKDELSFIMFHLWPNAYNSKTSEFASQQADMGSRRFYFAEQDQMGGYKQISFHLNKNPLEIQYVDGHEDIVKVILPEVIRPGKSVEITGSFHLDIPDGFSRLGKQRGAYQLTQWYPKPAVYDRNGWHPMPYLAMGEFYSEFGDYKVSITCPDKYVVACTGTIMNEEEVAIYNKMSESGGIYPVRGKLKTIKIEAENTHDFAIFLDDGFLVEKEIARINEGQDSVLCWGFYHKDGSAWGQSAFYVKRAIEYFSQHAGHYPYPQASAVEGLISAGGGMEYPMVTIIDPMNDPRSLDRVIAHEVAQNWFYGLLASNERENPWMDEGLTSYYEKRYMREYYEVSGEFPPILQKILGGSMDDLLYQLQARRGMEQAGCCSRKYSLVNYQLGAYSKPTLAYEYLEDLYGKSAVDSATRLYFKQWSFQHPQPLDLKSSFEESLKKDLSWLFDDLLQTTKHVDYAVTKGKSQNEVIIENRGEVAVPYRITGVDENQIIVDGHFEQKAYDRDADQETVEIDASGKSLDINALNNSRTKTNFLRAPDIHLVPGMHFKTPSVYLHPIMGWNNYDKYMLGLRVTNASLIPKTIVFNLNPMFGFGSDEVVGFADVHYNHFDHTSALRQWQVGAEYKRYNVREAILGDDDYSIEKWSPYLKFFFNENETRGVGHKISMKYDLIRSEFDNSGIDGSIFRDTDQFHRMAITYNWKKAGGIHPMKLSLMTEYGNYNVSGFSSSEDYLRTSVEYDVDLYYAEKSKVKVRSFIGYFPINSRRDAGSVNSLLARRSFGLAYQGYHDYLDHTFLGRSEQDGFLARQVAIAEGGFKTAFTSPMAMVIGNSNHAIASVNFEVDLPFQWWPAKWIKPYLDAGYYADYLPASDKSFEDQFLWSGGISLSIAKGLLAVHFPLIQSKNIDEVFDQAGLDNIGSRISFSLDVDRLRLIDFVESQQIRVQL